MVAGQIDLYTGGEGGKTPMRKLIPFSDRVLPQVRVFFPHNPQQGVEDEKESQTNKGEGRGAAL